MGQSIGIVRRFGNVKDAYKSLTVKNLFSTSFTVRKLLFLIYVLGIPCASWAQTNQASWANLSALRPGQKITIVAITSNKHTGTFVSFSDTAISYMETAGEQTTQKQGVRSVKLTENKRLRNTLIAGGVGAGVGAVIGAATFHPCSSPSFCVQPIGRGAQAGIIAVVGFVGGAVVGVLLPSHKTIYSVNSH